MLEASLIMLGRRPRPGCPGQAWQRKKGKSRPVGGQVAGWGSSLRGPSHPQPLPVREQKGDDVCRQRQYFGRGGGMPPWHALDLMSINKAS